MSGGPKKAKARKAQTCARTGDCWNLTGDLRSVLPTATIHIVPTPCEEEVSIGLADSSTIADSSTDSVCGAASTSSDSTSWGRVPRAEALPDHEVPAGAKCVAEIENSMHSGILSIWAAATMSLAEVEASMEAAPLARAPSVTEIEASMMSAYRRTSLQRQGAQALAKIDAVILNQQKAQGDGPFPIVDGDDAEDAKNITSLGTEPRHLELDPLLNPVSPSVASLTMDFTPQPEPSTTLFSATPHGAEFASPAGGMLPAFTSGCWPMEYAPPQTAAIEAMSVAEYQYACSEICGAVEYEAARGEMCRAFLAQALVAAAPEAYED